MTAASWYASTDEYEHFGPEGAEAAGAQKEAHSVNLDSSRQRLTPGTRVGDHLIVRGVLGEGGTAVVYEALHTRLGASVALKVVDIADEYMEGARARLLREAHVCASLEDPHIPRVYDVGELPDGTPYVVMERVSGRTLENVLTKGALPLDVAVRITDDLLFAVEAIEKAGIVHRDIKPPNIILQSGGDGTLRVRLMDFGVSKNVNAGRDAHGRDPSMFANPSLTQQGAIVGTPHYMAPEQIVGPSVDTRADLYAVGVVAYEMMAGRTPFEGQTTGEVVAAVLHTRPLPLGRLCDNVHPELEAWVDRAMALQRADRFSTAREMREALQDAWLKQRERLEEPSRRGWGRAARIVGVGAVALLAIGIATLPGGYDLHALTKLLRPEQARTPQPVDQASTLPAAVIPTTTQLPSDTEAKPSTAVQQPEAQAEAAAVEDALPQAERVRAATDDSDAADAPTPDEVADAPKAEPTLAPAAAANAPARVEEPPPSNTRRPRERAAARSAAPATTATGGDYAAPAETPPPRGVMLDEYLRQLDSKIKGTSLPAEKAPSERTPGQPAPNPFEPIPNNPYEGQ